MAVSSGGRIWGGDNGSGCDGGRRRIGGGVHGGGGGGWCNRFGVLSLIQCGGICTKCSNVALRPSWLGGKCDFDWHVGADLVR